jgi:hypothetical protein
MRRLVEENVIRIMSPHFATLGYRIVETADDLALVEIPGGGAKLHGTSG